MYWCLLLSILDRSSCNLPKCLIFWLVSINSFYCILWIDILLFILFFLAHCWIGFSFFQFLKISGSMDFFKLLPRISFLINNKKKKTIKFLRDFLTKRMLTFSFNHFGVHTKEKKQFQIYLSYVISNNTCVLLFDGIQKCDYI